MGSVLEYSDIATTIIDRFAKDRASDSFGHIATGLIGSHARRWADKNSDYDLICLWRDGNWLFHPDENIRIEETILRGHEVQIVFYRYDLISSLIAFFSAGNDINGDWGELGFEAYLAFIQEAQFLIGNQTSLQLLQQNLRYTADFRFKVLLSQTHRMINSLRQFFHTEERSRALFLKCRYDFLDSVLRILYAKAGLFYSTIKWYTQDLQRLNVSRNLQMSLERIIDGPDAKVIDQCIVAVSEVLAILDTDIFAEVSAQIDSCVQSGRKMGVAVENIGILLS